MARQVSIGELSLGAPFRHVADEGTERPQPERVFRVVAFRKRTALVENGVGVRTTMSKKTPAMALAPEAWAEIARSSLAAPIRPEERPATGEKAAS